MVEVVVVVEVAITVGGGVGMVLFLLAFLIVAQVVELLAFVDEVVELLALVLDFHSLHSLHLDYILDDIYQLVYNHVRPFYIRLRKLPFYLKVQGTHGALLHR